MVFPAGFFVSTSLLEVIKFGDLANVAHPNLNRSLIFRLFRSHSTSIRCRRVQHTMIGNGCKDFATMHSCSAERPKVIMQSKLPGMVPGMIARSNRCLAPILLLVRMILGHTVYSSTWYLYQMCVHKIRTVLHAPSMQACISMCIIQEKSYSLYVERPSVSPFRAGHAPHTELQSGGIYLMMGM